MIVLLLPLVAAILIWRYLTPEKQSDDEEHHYAFVLTGPAKPTPKCERYEARELTGEQVYLSLLRDSTRAMPSYGDTVVAYTHIERERGKSRAFAARYTVLPAKEKTLPLQWRLYHRLASAGLEEDELALVGALTLGYKEDLDPEVKHRFQASGAAHILAVSGLHTGIIYGVLLWLLTLGGRLKPQYENRIGRCLISLVIITAMWGYALLTGMTPSVVRAVLMVTMVEVGRMLRRQALSLNTIAAAAVLILLVRPSDLWSVSFQLSFAATAAIVVLYPKFRYNGIPIFRYFLSLIIVSLAAQIGTLPLTVYYFGQISTYFLLTNLIVLPIATVLVPCGLLTLLLGGCGIGMLIGKLTEALAWTMNHTVGWIEGLPGSTVPAYANGAMVAVYYLILLFYFVLFAYHKKKQ